VSFISVAVPVPFLDSLTYRVPDGIDSPPVGARVRVAVGTRTVTGCVVEHGRNGTAPDDVKEIAGVVDREPFLPSPVVELCRWVAEYYLAGIGDAIAAAMPPGARRSASSFKLRRVAALTAHAMALVQDRQSGGLTARQRSALETIGGATTALPLADLRERGITNDVIGRLAARGLVTITTEADERDPFERSASTGYEPDVLRQLTTEQTDALGVLGPLAGQGEFKVALLHGVTGSGKTEIYARLAGVVQQRERNEHR
jgi:primosomal protein N' (replication factor Y)